MVIKEKYVYVSQPHAVNNNTNKKSKYRPQGNNGNPQSSLMVSNNHDEQGNNSNNNHNLMYDRRVKRGNTYNMAHPTRNSSSSSIGNSKIGFQSSSSNHNSSSSNSSDNNQYSNNNNKQRRRRVREKINIYEFETPDLIQKELDIFKHLIEVPRDIHSTVNYTQTDAFKEDILMKETTQKIKIKTGIDRSTMIDESDHLFNMDIESIPIVETIVAKTIEQSLVELQEEEELKNLQLKMDELLKMKREEKKKIMELEASTRVKAKRRNAEFVENNKTREAKTTLLKKIGAFSLSKNLIHEFTNEIYEERENNGIWSDPVMKNVELNFMPFLYDMVSNNMKHYNMAVDTIDQMIIENDIKQLEIAQKNK